ncbi:LamG-like jellyroll fold domain-containing protein [Catenulispora sp. GAS73]|uniref:LamG-like jellyroll fold domain-containing protein n=1 Tax=Catenulispora sp. GAS73 TaxID=3156269 RepID=UPI003513AF20
MAEASGSPADTEAAKPTVPAPDQTLRKALAEAHAQAKKTKKAVVVDAATNPYALTLAQPDGTFNVEQVQYPIRTKVNGAWVPINTKLALAADGSVHPKAVPTGITISGGGTAPLLQLDTNGKKISLSWPTTLPKPTLSGNSAVYASVYPDVDLKVTADALGVREVLIVKSAQAAANPALSQLQLGVAANGITISADTAGGVRGTDSTGTPVFTGTPALMWDSSTTSGSTSDGTTPTRLPMATAPGQPTTASASGPGAGSKKAVMPTALHGSTVDLTPDAGLLHGSSTRFPLFIDPDVWAPIQNWAELDADAPSQNNYDQDPSGTPNLLRVGDQNAWAPRGGQGGTGVQRLRRSMISFSLTQGTPGAPAVVPAGATVTAANFDATTNTYTCASQSIDMFAINSFSQSNSSWNGQSLTGPNSWGAAGSAWWGAALMGTASVYSAGSCTPADYTGGAGATYTLNVTSKVSTWVSQGAPVANFGFKAHDESTWQSAGFAAFYRFNSDCNPNNITAADHCGNMHLRMTYRLPPKVVATTVSPNLYPNNSSCDTTVPSANGGPAYLPKTINGSVTVSEEVEDIDNGALTVDFGLNNLTPGGGSGGQTGLPAQNGVPTGAGWVGSDGWYHFKASATFNEDTGGSHAFGTIFDGNSYGAAIFGIKDTTFLNTYFPNNTPNGGYCFLTAAFSAPSRPTINSNDFPKIGSVPVKTATASGTLSFAGQVTGVSIDHFDWVLNRDSSLVGNTTAGGGSVKASGNGSTLTLPQGATVAGENTLWVQAVDKASNRSPIADYEFYTRGNPNKVAVLGDVTGGSMPDLVTIEPDGHGASHLVVVPGNYDPAMLVSNLPAKIQAAATEAASASAAPDGKSWAGTLITHRGAERGTPTDDLFAYSPTTHQLYYYFNASGTLDGIVPADQYTVQHQALITRPPCDPTVDKIDGCADYAPNWNKVLQIVAFGSVTGGNPGVFAGKTNLLTVESDGTGGAELWLFHPSGVGQLTAPILIGRSNLNGTNYSALPGWNWANMDVIAAGKITGDTSNGKYPDLWARDRTTGTLWQFDNIDGASGEDPTSLGNLNAAKIVGGSSAAGSVTAQGPFSVAHYPVLVSAGSTTMDTSGNLSQGGYPALAALQPDGKIQQLPGSASGPVIATGANSGSLVETGQSLTAWSTQSSAQSLNGATPTTTSGPIRVGWTSGNTSNPLCLDLVAGNTTNGSPIQQTNCVGNTNQNWSLYPDGSIRLTANQSKCITVLSNYNNSSGTLDGSTTVISDCLTNNDPNDPNAGAIEALQRWVVRPSPTIAGWSQLYNPNSGRCLDNEASNQINLQPWLWDCFNSSAPQQAWLLPGGQGSVLQTEAEVLANYAVGTGASVAPQPNVPGVSWSGGAQMFLSNNVATGSRMTLTWYVPYPGLYHVAPVMTQAVGYGKVSMAVDIDTSPQYLPNTFDGYSATAKTTSFDFGIANITTAGLHSFSFIVNGANPAATGNKYNAGVDTIVLNPAQPQGPKAALAATPNSSGTGTTVTLDASATTPGTAPITTYTFNFGDGGTTGPQNTATATHTYTWSGNPTRVAQVTVTDSAGNTGTANVTITVGPTPLTALTVNDGHSTQPCTTDPTAAPNMGSTTVTLSGTADANLSANFEVRDVTDPSLAPPLQFGGPGSYTTVSTTPTVTTPVLQDGHEYAFAGRTTDSASDVSATSTSCYFWATTTGNHSVASGALGAAMDNTFIPATAGPVDWKTTATDLRWQPDGNLVLYTNDTNTAIWSSNTGGATNAVLGFMQNGDLAIFPTTPTLDALGNTTATPLWHSGTAAGFGQLLIGSDGNVSILKQGTPLWSTNTAIAPTTPFHAWTLTDGYGTSATDTGYPGANGPAPAALTGTTTWTGSGVTFDGTTGNATTAPAILDPTKSFSISAWANPAALGGAVLSEDGNTQSSFALYPDTASKNWTFALGTSDAAGWNVDTVSANPVALNSWVHLTATYDATSKTFALYTNGTLAASGTHNNGFAATGPLAIGREKTGGAASGFFNGTIGDVRTWTYALPATQVSWLYQRSANNLAVAKTASASSSISGWEVPHLTDGIIHGGGWSSAAHNTSAATEWAGIDLGATNPLTEVDLYPRDDTTATAGTCFPTAFTIAVSTDNTNWTTVSTQTAYPKPADGPQKFLFAKTPGRYIKVTGTALTADSTGNYYMQLRQIAAYTGANVLPGLTDPTWTANGTATITGNTATLTTDGTANAAGSVVNSTAIKSAGLTATFQATISGAASTGADGMTFALLDSTTTTSTALGQNGGGLGIAGLTGVFVSLDTFGTLGVYGSSNWAGINTTTPTAQTNIANNTNIPTLRNTGPHTVKVTVTPASHIVVNIDGTQVLDAAVTLPPSVLVAFTASTGGSTDTQAVTNPVISYTS